MLRNSAAHGKLPLALRKTHCNCAAGKRDGTRRVLRLSTEEMAVLLETRRLGAVRLRELAPAAEWTCGGGGAMRGVGAMRDVVAAHFEAGCTVAVRCTIEHGDGDDGGLRVLTREETCLALRQALAWWGPAPLTCGT